MLSKKTVGVSPHIRTLFTMESTMYDVVIALLPVIIMSIIIYGYRVALLLITAVLSGLLTEYISSKALGLENQSFDGSGIVTTVLFTLTLPVTVPFKVIIVGSVASILIGKILFGGVGKNIFNPALVGRLIVMISFPQYVYDYTQVDGIGGASVFPLLKYIGNDVVFDMFGGKATFYKGLLYGNSQLIRSMGEVSLVAIILGAVYLKLKGHIKIKVPIILLLTLGTMYFISGESPFLYVLTGGVCFAAVYMLTDMVTSPYTNIGLILYSVLVAIFTYFIRKFTSQPEGVTFAILIANICVPTINKYTLPRSFGGKHNMKKVLIFLITIIVVFVLSYGVFEIDELIEKYEVKKETEIRDEKLELLFGEGVEAGEASEAKLSDEGYYFQPINKDDELLGHLVIFESKGYSTDMVKIIMGIDLDGVITGLKVLEQNETLGLGAQVQSEEWTSLWKGRDLTYEFDKSVDAYTGATFTFLNAYKEIMSVLESYEYVLMDELDEFDFEDFEEFEDDDLEVENLETEEIVAEDESEAGDA